jgi:hypothetical protein
MTDEDMTSSDVTAEWVPTPDGRGRLFTMLPGKRIVLEQYDQWHPNQEEPLLAQCSRVSHSPKEQERRRLGAQRLKERLSRVPFYAKKARKYADEDKYWEGFYASRIHS